MPEEKVEQKEKDIDVKMTLSEIELMQKLLATHESVNAALQVQEGNERLTIINKLYEYLPKEKTKESDKE